MTLSTFFMIPRRSAPAVLALLLVLLTGGFRLGEWTLCVEPDGRVHSESNSGDCAGDDRGHHSDAHGDGPRYETAMASDADCGDCLDITGRLHGMRLKFEGVPPPALHLSLAAHDLRLPPDSARNSIRRAAIFDWSRFSALTCRATDTIILTC